MVVKLGSPAIPVYRDAETGQSIAKIEHLWRAVRAWAKREGYVYDGSYGVVGVGAT